MSSKIKYFFVLLIFLVILNCQQLFDDVDDDSDVQTDDQEDMDQEDSDQDDLDEEDLDQEDEEINPEEENLKSEDLNSSNSSSLFDSNESDDFYSDLGFKNIKLLSDKNYTQYIKNQNAIIFLHENYNPESSEFLQEYVKASLEIDFKKTNISFYRMDGEKNKNFTYRYNIYKFPYVLIIKGENYFSFEFDKTKKHLLNFIEKKIFGDYQRVSSQKEVEKNIEKSNSNFTVLITMKNDDTPTFKTFIEYSENNDIFNFIICTSNECIKLYGEDIVLFNKITKKQFSFIKEYSIIFRKRKENYQSFTTENITLRSLKRFLGIYSKEDGYYLNNELIEMIYEFNQSVLFYFRNETNNTQIQYDKFFEELSQKLKYSDIYVFISNVNTELGINALNEFRIEPIELPTLLYYVSYDHDDMNSYRITNISYSNLNEKFILKYLEDIKNGKIEKDPYSENYPDKESQDYIEAQIIVGKTFVKEVLEYKGNVCLLFATKDFNEYPMCESYINVFKELGHKHKGEKDYIVKYAVIDAEANEVKGFKIKDEDELPIIYLYKNEKDNKKSMIKFNTRDITNLTANDVEDFVVNNLDLDKNEDL